MLHLLRKVRRSLLAKQSTTKYLLYASGEIALVVIGILIALQINNWNEVRKERLVEQGFYQNLLTALRQDSAELVRILDLQSQSMGTQFSIINLDYSQVIEPLSEDEIKLLITKILRGNFSFFPKYGTYNSIQSTTGLEIFRSEEIKSRLIDLYDYRYNRNEMIGETINQKYGFGMEPFMNGQLQIFIEGYDRIGDINLTNFQKNYDELIYQCKNTYNWVKTSHGSLVETQVAVNQIIDLIREELNSS